MYLRSNARAPRSVKLVSKNIILVLSFGQFIRSLDLILIQARNPLPLPI